MLKKIQSKDLRVGMYLQEFCGSWMQHPFWRNRFLIKDPNDIEQILASGIVEVWIDPSKGLDVAVETEAPETETKVPEPPIATKRTAIKSPSLDVEIERAAKICDTAKGAVTAMFQEARMGRAVDAEACASLVNDIASSVIRNPSAIISLARLKNADEYTYMHSVAVCALMIALARQLELDETTTREAGMAGLLHDLGKALVPLDVLNKPGKLTDEEFNVVRGHPQQGYELLKEANGVGEIALDVCLHHHEKTDGTGYPDRLNAEKISLYAKMGAICDVYDAITSDRPYKKGWSPVDSIKRMAGWCQGHFDEAIFKAFVRSVGIYPTGSLVKLESGKLAVVLEQNDKTLIKPRVKIFYHTKTREKLSPKVLDLASQSANDAIAQREEPETWNLKPAFINELWTGDLKR